MHFGFSTEQDELATLARNVAGDLAGLDDGSAARAADDLTVLVKTGLCGLLVPEEAGGAGATIVEAAIVAEALGRTLAPVTVAGSFLIAPAALDLVADHGERGELAAGIAEGRPCAIEVDTDLSWPPKGSGLAWAWHPEATVLLACGEGLSVAAPGTYEGRPTEDPTLLVAPTGEARLDGVVAESEAAQRFLATANVVVASVLLGHMRACLDLAVAYAGEREQFGVKIGSFQAVKHLCADMLVDTEASHSIVLGAAATLASGAATPAVSRTAAAAKAWCAEAAVRVCESSIQVHGGIGFTWECPVHRYLRATLALGASFSNPMRSLDLITRLDQWT